MNRAARRQRRRAVQAYFHSLLRGDRRGCGPALQRAGLWALSHPYGWAVGGPGRGGLVLGDGFQHRRVQRDLDLVLMDATAPWGHDFLLPRGLLREPADGLKRASLILLTRCDQARPEALAEIHERARHL